MSAYALWQNYAKLFPKKSRYSLGTRIDTLFFDVIDSINTASFVPKLEKLPYIKRGITKLDSLKLFIQIAWQLEALENKNFIILSEHLTEVGKMLGGWKNQIQKQLITTDTKTLPLMGEK